MSLHVPRLRVEPFSIQLGATVFADLRSGINSTRWPHEVPGITSEQGTDLAYLQRVLRYWADQFDWPARERDMNAFHHLLPSWMAFASTSSTGH